MAYGIKGGIFVNTRVASKADIKIIRNMWENSRGRGIFTDWFFNNIFYSDNSVVTEENGVPLACSCMVPHKMVLNETEFDAGYIGAMTANPENRTQEIMNVLAADTLGFIAGRGMPVAFTVPDNYKFYEKYGFALCYDYKQYDIAPNELPLYGVNGSILRPACADEEVIRMLNGIYSQFMRGRTGYLIRTPENWKLIIDDLYKNFDGKCVIYKDDKDGLLGYMLYIVRDSKMGVYEMAYTGRKGYEGLIGFIKSHEGLIDRVSLKVPSDDRMYLSFCDNRMAVKSCPFVMARITDAKEILKSFAAKAPADLRLQVIDRVIEENNKTFAFTDGDVITIDTDANVTTDIGTLTQLVMGYLSVEEAFFMNLVKGDMDVLQQIFKKRSTYINMLSV